MCATLAPYHFSFVFLYIFMVLDQLCHNLKFLEHIFDRNIYKRLEPYKTSGDTNG